MTRRLAIIPCVLGLVAFGCAGEITQDDSSVDESRHYGGFCGDGVCKKNESCSTCPQDCGQCSTASPDLGSTPPPSVDLAQAPVADLGTVTTTTDLAQQPVADLGTVTTTDLAQPTSGYPAGPYGTSAGSTIANFTYYGYYTPDFTSGLVNGLGNFGPISLDQIRKSGKRYLLAGGYGTGCGAELDPLATQIDALSQSSSFLSQVFFLNEADPHTYNTQATLDTWVQGEELRYASVYPTDLTNAFGGQFGASYVIVDLSDMKILEVIPTATGANLEPTRTVVIPGPSDQEAVTLPAFKTYAAGPWILTMLDRAFSDLQAIVANAPAVCGDGKCTQRETAQSCPSECSIAPTCNTSNWPSTSASLENQVLTLVNQQRASGATCYTGGVAKQYPPAPPLVMNAALQQAARCHTLEMAEFNYFPQSHLSLTLQTPMQRVAAAGYTSSYVGENAAAGPSTALAVVTGWMLSTEGHCDNVMNANYKSLGVGFANEFATDTPYNNYWTQDFGGL